LARRFREHETMIPRFVVDLAVPWTNNLAERDVRPVKVQQRTAGGRWRTLQGLADFAVVRSYVSTAAKWGINKPRRLRAAVHHRRLAPPSHRPLLNSYRGGTQFSSM